MQYEYKRFKCNGLHYSEHIRDGGLEFRVRAPIDDTAPRNLDAGESCIRVLT